MTVTGSNLPKVDWESPWWGAAGFFWGIGSAWYLGWQTRDLVWGLWLSSLVVGWTIVFWGLCSRVRRTHQIGASVMLLAFLTLHFGLFHLIHAAALNMLFPIELESGVPSVSAMGRVLHEYWWFLPAAFLAERAAFIHAAENSTGHPINVIADAGSGFLRPYRNVFRMHALIFFFILANLVRLENIAVYAVVYAVYFFPWHILKEEEAEDTNLS